MTHPSTPDSAPSVEYGVRAADIAAVRRLRIAIVHEWMVHYGGGVERVATALARLFPDADHFALVHEPNGLRGSPLEELDVSPSCLQRFPLSRRLYRLYLPLMPMAVEGLDLSRYDLVISLSHAVARGVLTTPNQLHLSYLQARNLKYAYEDRAMYRRRGLLGLVQDEMLSRLRVWDSIAALRPDATISNSAYVRRWHLHRHGVDSVVVHPPVDLASFSPAARGGAGQEYYITVGRLEPYKRVDAIVDAFRGSTRHLLVVGDGSQLADLRRRSARSPNISFTGMLGTDAVADALRRARAFVFASREDFGIAPLEAQACGVPVVAFGEGGALETVVPWPDDDATGLFFAEQTPESIRHAVERLESVRSALSPQACVANAARFGPERFEREFMDVVHARWATFAQAVPRTARRQVGNGRL